jgi:hypothetical protein
VRDTTQPTRCPHRAWCPASPRPAAAIFAGLALAFLTAQAARAQASDRLSIDVAPIITAEPATQVLFPIRVGEVPHNSFVRVQGLPRGAALSEGHAIAPGAWAVPLNALPRLRIVLPTNVAGKADVTVLLVGRDGLVLSKTTSTLVVGAPPPVSAPEDRKRALLFLQKGHERLAEGQVAAARVLYERCADLGLAQAALALAGTYDAAELDRPHLLGIQPNASEAWRWYERARRLGAPEADQRLQRLRGK